jgi:hypothetical protein
MYPYNDMAFVFVARPLLAKAAMRWFSPDNFISGKVWFPPPFLCHKLYICPSSNKNNQH